MALERRQRPTFPATIGDRRVAPRVALGAHLSPNTRFNAFVRLAA
jgi:hypothetical protein